MRIPVALRWIRHFGPSNYLSILLYFLYRVKKLHTKLSVSFLMSMDTFSEGTLEIIIWLVEFLCRQDFSLLCSSVLTRCWPWLKYFSQILDLSIKFLDFWLPFTWSSTSKACLTAHTVAAVDSQDLVCTMKLDRSLQLSQTSSPLPADSKLKTRAWSATIQRDFFFFYFLNLVWLLIWFCFWKQIASAKQLTVFYL